MTMNHAVFKYFALIIAAVISINYVQANEIPSEIKKQLEILFPSYDVNSVKVSVIPGMYEFIGDGQVLYISKDGRYVVNGYIIDMEEKVNLTEKTQNMITQQVIANYDEKKMIVFAAEGKVRHTITTFTDVDCPYCGMLHKEVPKLNKAGVTMRYLMFPRAGPGSPTFIKSVSVWCSDDQKKALGAAKNGVEIEAKTCDNPVLEQFELGQKLGVTGTPTMILENGNILPGFVPAAQLIKILDDQG